jgi:GGDEF domain-containing protein
MEKYGSIYTAMLFQIKDESRINEFWDFLLKYLRISDTVFSYRDNKLLVILEETTTRWSMILNESLRERIEKKWFKYDYYCASIQWDFIDSDEKLLKSLNKRLKIAKQLKTKECIHALSDN